MFVLPLRAKNPPERYPWATIGIIAANTLVFALTSENFLSIQESVVDSYALSHHTFSLLRLFTSMWLHGSLLHLLGNMLFLYIFGTAVEGRLGIPRFLALYLSVGIAGTLCHDLVDGVIHPRQFGFGASGAIMGLGGAYVYLFPFARILVLYCYSMLLTFRAGFAEWQAQWVVLYFIAWDVFYGLLFHGLDGTAHFAHIGGFATGFLLMLLLRLPRDSEEASVAQATRVDAGGNLLTLSLPELEALWERDPASVPVAMAFLRKAATHYDPGARRLGADALRSHVTSLLETASPTELATIVFSQKEFAEQVPASLILRLGGKLESVGAHEQAASAYHLICSREPITADTEMALARLARLTEQTNTDKGQSAAIYSELVRLFPEGPQAPYAQNALRRLGKPTIVFSAGKGKATDPSPQVIPDGLATVTSAAMATTGVATPTPSTEERTSAENAGLAPLQSPAAAGTTEVPAAAPAALDSWYVGDVRGMTLRPIGAPAEETSGEKS